MTPFFEHLSQEFGRQVLSAQTCGSYSPASDGERWYVARTHYNMEFVALVDLKRLGFSAHLPMFVEPTLRNPSRPKGPRKGSPVIRRLFPGFVFVALDLQDDRWAKAREARGVDKLLARTGGAPAAVPWVDMSHLLQRAGDVGYEDDVIYMRPSKERSKFINITALSSEERIAVLMDVMTRLPGNEQAA